MPRQPAILGRAGWLLAIVLSGSITITQQKWVGGMTVYEPERQAVRDMMHESILNNRLPDSVSTWREIGGNGLNLRVLTVWIAEGIHRLSGISVQRSYLYIGTIALFASCLLLCAFLGPYTGWPFALASLLYWGTVLPLTYLRHNFHPWDRPSIALWILALICVRKRRWWPLVAVLAVGVAIKYDMLVFPILVFLAFRESEPWTVTVPRTALLLALTISIFILLRWLIPGGMEPRPVFNQVRTNLADLREMAYYYPPFLALGPPTLLAAIGYSSADQFAKACVQLAGLVAAILFLQTNFVEFRAEVPLLLLLLPAAWFGLMRLSRNDAMRTGESAP